MLAKALLRQQDQIQSCFTARYVRAIYVYVYVCMCMCMCVYTCVSGSKIKYRTVLRPGMSVRYVFLCVYVCICMCVCVHICEQDLKSIVLMYSKAICMHTKALLLQQDRIQRCATARYVHMRYVYVCVYVCKCTYSWARSEGHVLMYSKAVCMRAKAFLRQQDFKYSTALQPGMSARYA